MSAHQRKPKGKAAPAAAQKPNQTGLPNNLKSGIENVTGHDMSDVRVNYNSPAPAALNAQAYTQGNDIALAPAPSNELLGHELTHVVQQRQGRVE